MIVQQQVRKIDWSSLKDLNFDIKDLSIMYFGIGYLSIYSNISANKYYDNVEYDQNKKLQ